MTNSSNAGDFLSKKLNKAFATINRNQHNTVSNNSATKLQRIQTSTHNNSEIYNTSANALEKNSTVRHNGNAADTKQTFFQYALKPSATDSTALNAKAYDSQGIFVTTTIYIIKKSCLSTETSQKWCLLLFRVFITSKRLIRIAFLCRLSC